MSAFAIILTALAGVAFWAIMGTLEKVMQRLDGQTVATYALIDEIKARELQNELHARAICETILAADAAKDPGAPA